MFKFVTIYRQVDDSQAIDAFFSTTQLQLSEQLPGLMRTAVSRITGKPGGQSRFYMMYALYFESQTGFELALMSEPGIKLMEALKPWADAKIITWFYTDTFEEER